MSETKRRVVVITRHDAYVEYLLEMGIITAESRASIIQHATEDDVRDATVITSGLPLALAALAFNVITIDLDVPVALRGEELNLAQVKQYAGKKNTYKVIKLTSV